MEIKSMNVKTRLVIDVDVHDYGMWPFPKKNPEHMDIRTLNTITFYLYVVAMHINYSRKCDRYFKGVSQYAKFQL